MLFNQPKSVNSGGKFKFLKLSDIHNKKTNINKSNTNNINLLKIKRGEIVETVRKTHHPRTLGMREGSSG
ncbi:hypothetical protein [Methanococcus voltae]|jgi:predicted amidohydrolase|uniref:hypothetical protein n=1 Tax=Methanococcus voltae TaxID=2188 RepID=UPI001AE9A560|nr:hypothetical protein [Methanococcus voltae]